MRPEKTWAYGVTTVPARISTTLPGTLRSLKEAGFDKPRLFIDGLGTWGPTDLATTVRNPKVGVVGNFYLALLETYIREPTCERYAIFQDDILCVKGLKEYLSATTLHHKCYWNLYTFLNNERHVAGSAMGTWQEGALIKMDDDNPQRLQAGLGALGLVFTREGVQTLLSAPSMVNKPLDSRRPTTAVDGAIVTAMNLAGWREMVHYPTLLYHTGRLSTVEPGKEWVSAARSWMGEEWDARTLLTRANT